MGPFILKAIFKNSYFYLFYLRKINIIRWKGHQAYVWISHNWRAIVTARGMSLSTIIIFTKKMEIKKKKNHNDKKKKKLSI